MHGRLRVELRNVSKLREWGFLCAVRLICLSNYSVLHTYFRELSLANGHDGRRNNAVPKKASGDCMAM